MESPGSARLGRLVQKRVGDGFGSRTRKLADVGRLDEDAVGTHGGLLHVNAAPDAVQPAFERSLSPAARAPHDRSRRGNQRPNLQLREIFSHG